MAARYQQVSGKYRPRQVEFHPFEEKILFGTVRGNLCLTNIDDKSIQYLGNYGTSPYDSILGLCWLKANPYRFISGSSNGRLVCGDIRADAVVEAGPSVVSHVKEYAQFSELTSVHSNCSNEWLLVSGYEKKARIYDVETGTIFMEYEDIHTKAINISRFMNHSPFLLATSSFDGVVKSWDMRMRRRSPIYEIVTDSGYVVMINFSPDDNFMLISGQDNDISQHLTLDGRKHTSFDVPCTGLQEHNYTRAYYSSTGAYIVTGACEDSAVSMLCTSTGRLLNRFEVYPNRKHSSLYVQSLRGSPLSDNRICVLTSYKDIRSRELVVVDLDLPVSKVEVGGRNDGVQWGSSQHSVPCAELKQQLAPFPPGYQPRTSAFPSPDLYNSLGALRCKGRLLVLPWANYSYQKPAADHVLSGIVRVSSNDMDSFPGIDMVIVFGAATRLAEAAATGISEELYTTVHSCVLAARCQSLSGKLIQMQKEFRYSCRQMSVNSDMFLYLPVVHINELICCPDGGIERCSAFWWPFIFDFIYSDVPLHQRLNICSYWAQRELFEHRNHKLLTSLACNTICTNEGDAVVKRSEIAARAKYVNPLDNVAVTAGDLCDPLSVLYPDTDARQCDVFDSGTGQLEFDCKYFGVNIFTARLVCVKEMNLSLGDAKLSEGEIVEDEILWRVGPIVLKLVDSIAQVVSILYFGLVLIYQSYYSFLPRQPSYN
jgi:hypothetical protein